MQMEDFSTQSYEEQQEDHIIITYNQSYYHQLLNSPTTDTSLLHGGSEQETDTVKDWQGELIEVRKYPCIWNTRAKSFR